MKDVWAITRRIMSRLLARLRRRMALTAAFQSNQNDRVTLERRREDIFLASRSHRDAAFFFFLPDTPHPPPPRLRFIYLIWVLLRRRSHGRLVSAGMPVLRRSRTHETSGGASPPREQTRDWLLHITRSSLTSLSLGFFFFFLFKLRR